MGKDSFSSLANTQGSNFLRFSDLSDFDLVSQKD